MPKRGENQKEAAPYDLKAVRERLGMTQVAMATLLRSAQSSVARWENEGSLPLIYRDFLTLHELLKRKEAQEASPKPKRKAKAVPANV